jgi:hypothetical protein
MNQGKRSTEPKPFPNRNQSIEKSSPHHPQKTQQICLVNTPGICFFPKPIRNQQLTGQKILNDLPS